MVVVVVALSQCVCVTFIFFSHSNFDIEYLRSYFVLNSMLLVLSIKCYWVDDYIANPTLKKPSKHFHLVSDSVEKTIIVVACHRIVGNWDS